MRKALIISPGILPVPATKGGAIEATIELIVQENEVSKQLDLFVFSIYERKAFELSKKFKYTQFIWVRKGFAYSVMNFFLRVIRKVIRKVDHLDSEILKYFLKRNRFHKVIIHGNTTYLTTVAKVYPKEKIILYVHANIFNNRNFRNITLAKTSGKIVCVSNFIKRKILENTESISNNICVIKNPIDYYAFSNCKNEPDLVLRKKLGVEDDDIVLIFVGRIVENKGILHLLKALSLINSNKQFKLIVIGSFGSNFGVSDQKDVFRDQVLHQAKSLGNDKVIFEGFVHNRDLPKYHSFADILIMPSLVEESAGKVAMEAMASSTPVITTTAGGIPEYVNSNAGILVDRGVNFVKDLSIAISTLVNDPNLRKKFGNEGKAAAKEFHPHRYYTDYVKLLKNIL